MIRRGLTLLLIIVAQAIPATAASKDQELDRWVDRDLVPYVRQQLLAHPRFKGETVMFVVLRDNVPAAVSNALALSLRDRLLDAAVDTPGVSIGWQQGRGTSQLAPAAIDCTQNDVHYYIGLELEQLLDSRYAVTLRALDLEDRSWVTGFGRGWQGRLTTIQRQAMRQARVDETFLGSRDVPFNLAQTDLLAAHLAHALSCTLLRGDNGEYVVARGAAPVRSDVLAGTVELAANNLANHASIEIARDGERVNARLSGKAHPIDGPLYQYWLTITPEDPADGLSAVTTSAYVLMPEPALADERPSRPDPAPPTVREPVDRAMAASVSIPNRGNDALLGPLRITRPLRPADCDPRKRSLVTDAKLWALHAKCSLLTATANSDTIVFFLAHQANHGMVRLGDPACRHRASAALVRGNEPVQFPIPRTAANPLTAEILDWRVSPGRDTYYVIAVNEARLARRMANHIDKLPLRCTDAMRSGLMAAELKAWLDEFALLAADAAQHFDWRAITVKDVT